MKNSISTAYQFADDGLMYCANKAVQSYNWTFGGTKEELANNLLSVGSIAVPIGVFIS